MSVIIDNKEVRECSKPNSPSMFPDDWGTGRKGRAQRSIALSRCRICTLRQDCAKEALIEADAGLDLYGIRGGIVFNDITRQASQIVRLRSMVNTI